MKIYPAMDLLNGECVRLYQGDYQQKTTYGNDPISVAQGFQQAGATWLHVVDLQGAKDPAQRQLPLIKRLVQETDLAIQTGGGIRTQQQIDDLLAQGAQRVMIGSLAVQDPATVKQWLQTYGEKLVLTLDVRLDEQGVARVATHGWQETSGMQLFDLIDDYLAVGLANVLCTDIACDGTLAGPNLDLYQQLLTRYPALHIIASGGVSSVQDLDVLRAMYMPGVVIGKALYEERFALEDVL